jgi:uncharacterized protein YjhX (UPF0386 family)
MKGSMTFEFSGDPNDYRVCIFRDGELDSGELEAIAILVEQEIKLKKRIASGEIKPTRSDPTGFRQLHSRWSN